LDWGEKQNWGNIYWLSVVVRSEAEELSVPLGVNIY
jgi:hypothetical protein